ncbi:unnamed protein product (macronuclear) [Paramecium tetraurelia]|uniref:Protein kinase domain-containing protein n=1 Tax=Paramecium tetraurelia TaxID=5888 RepID=A0CXE5_PARTE|nr:uncharacterized protein GSPATT00011094001 [Paramecium tetraurelia]CAK75462.1 unnamed protein product [Paramecium tetraurelia]|eukprot:XP_001442859.1 hypothetical protein (macronuclear) [Paramecium tetraurelia strain d4-2]
MGNTDSNASIKSLHMNYVVVRNINDDPRYGNGRIVRQKQTKQEAFQKEMNSTDEYQFKKLKVMLERMESNTYENLINFAYVELYFHKESEFCGQLFQIYILLEYIPQSLKEVTEKRLVNKQQFKERDLMQILRGCIEALFVLQSYNITHQGIRPETISYSEQQQLVKLTDPTVSGMLSSYQLVVQEDLKQINQCYLSPQLMQSLNDEVQPQHNPYKSDVYSLGMTMLYLSTLNNCNDCYDIHKLRVIVQQVQRRLQQMETSFSSQYVFLLKRMLLLNEDQRPDFIQLKYELQASQSPQFYEEEQVIQKAPIVQVQAYEQVMDTIPIQLQSVQMVSQSQERANSKIQPSIRNSQIQKSQELRQSQYSNQSIYIDGSEVKELRPDLSDHIKILPLSEQIAEPSRIDNNIGNQIGIEHFSDITQGPDQQQLLMPVTSFETSQQYELFLEMQKSKSNYNLSDQSQKVNYNMRLINSSNIQRYEKVIELYPNGSKYEGEKQNGVRQGYGIFLFQDNGGVYEGQWHDNKMHGIGNNFIVIKGTLFYASGKPAYEGEWFNDKFQGKGTLYNEEPQMLFGQFDYGDFDQVGEYWTKYVGQFNDDNKEGQGTLYLSNGEKFEGTFLQDLISGFGRYFKANGQEVQGRWWRNKLQK